MRTNRGHRQCRLLHRAALQRGKRCVTLLGVVALIVLSAWGNPGIVERLEQTGKLTLCLPDGLKGRLVYVQSTEPQDTGTQPTMQQNTRVGYRVLIFDDNNVRTAKHSAQSYKQQAETRFPEFKAYVQFNSPYWRVKVGDFPTRSEAEAAMAALKQAFPALSSQMRVVRDRINPQ